MKNFNIYVSSQQFFENVKTKLVASCTSAEAAYAVMRLMEPLEPYDTLVIDVPEVTNRDDIGTIAQWIGSFRVRIGL